MVETKQHLLPTIHTQQILGYYLSLFKAIYPRLEIELSILTTKCWPPYPRVQQASTCVCEIWPGEVMARLLLQPS